MIPIPFWNPKVIPMIWENYSWLRTIAIVLITLGLFPNLKKNTTLQFDLILFLFHTNMIKSHLVYNPLILTVYLSERVGLALFSIISASFRHSQIWMTGVCRFFFPLTLITQRYNDAKWQGSAHLEDLCFRTIRPLKENLKNKLISSGNIVLFSWRFTPSTPPSFFFF